MARRTPPPQLIGSGLIPETFQSEYAGYENAYQDKLAGLGRDERSLFADYGFQGGVGTDGAVNFGADPNAQHGHYQQLLQNIGGQLGQAKNEVRGRGIGRAGLAKARENLIRFMMSGEKSGLLGNFNKSASNIFGQRGAALTDRNRNFTGVEGRALDWWNQYGPDDPAGNVAGPAPSGLPFGVEEPTPSFAPAQGESPLFGGKPLLQPDGGMENIDTGANYGDYNPGMTPSFAPPLATDGPYWNPLSLPDGGMNYGDYNPGMTPSFAPPLATDGPYWNPLSLPDGGMNYGDYNPGMYDPYPIQPAGPIRRKRTGGGGGGPMDVM